MSPLFISLLSSLAISLISLIGVILFLIKSKKLPQITLALVSLAVGCLLGDAFIHLIPESFEFFEETFYSPLLVLAGLLLFFVLERIIHWRHCHRVDCLKKDVHQHPVVMLNLIGDAIHNFVDGALIAASFQVSIFLGFTTTIAIVFHEIPQEISDFAIFIHYGLSTKKAIFYNLLSALTSVLGVLFVFLISNNVDNFSKFLIPITAGAFIYLATSDLIPELNRHHPKISTSLIQLFFILLGILLMFLLLFL